MERNDVEKKVIEIFEEELEIEVASLSMSRADCEAWDSLMQLIITGDIEECFGIKLPLKTIQEADTIGKFVDCICELSGR